VLDITPTKGGEQTMRKSLWLIAAALSYGSGAFAQEALSLDITVGTNVAQKPDFKGKDGEWVGREMYKDLFENLTFFNIKKRSGPKNVNVEYRCKFYCYGETEWKREGQDCVTSKGGRAMLVGFALRLTGEGAKNYRLTYECRVFNNNVIFSTLSPQYCGGDDTELVV
jgi:hypothetical protein